MSELTSLISSVGFPIAMCLIMCYYIKYTNDQHKQEIDSVSEALNNNTLVLQKLCDKLEKGE